ncbi:hypothetical protein GUITHDRAFT_117793 [Guillardia theta CCMP2712]|uniref:Haloacid dehalogenase-like hydrolase n=1 Tax=Guillardia theta (strain CCMP2712) TaxID=905079 RepID=L1IIC4_GUITC|nr:hypothetical protein GUITHDRAFT_117793 [Guillardia theta CCMP2712]EKX36008.1 hypothetical protein GUITHDRAFT_117793 [Guillardia theta CCMP2712]|eukprot:XP_005822988.1 hypothetical protein GUITHDRAFT_117793 [Guillardia theta CCMP2712]
METSARVMILSIFSHLSLAYCWAPTMLRSAPQVSSVARRIAAACHDRPRTRLGPRMSSVPSTCGEDALLSRTQKFQAIFTDVDGTLLNKQHQLDPETCAAINEAVNSGVKVVMATGVFIQGLLVCDNEGNAIQEIKLGRETVQELVTYSNTHQITIVAYTDKDMIVTSETNKDTDVLRPYNEPPPTSVGEEGMRRLGAEGELCVYKMMFIGEEAILKRHRPEIEQKFAGVAAVTKAMDGMLEILPPGASKASGVRRAMQALGVSPAACMAMGDGENDLEMLKLVKEAGGLAVAVGNAVPKLKEVADRTVNDHDKLGAAEAIRLVLESNAKLS